MSLFNWFSGKPGQDESFSVQAPDSDSSGLTRDERTRPVAGARAKVSVPVPLNSASEQSGGQKTQRHAKRELLYAAVREAMIRAGVLSASYKFKVLSLDPRGDQFMVMMDLAQEFGGQTERLAEIEALIAQSAKSRYNIRVTAVYWRMNELVSIGSPRPSAHAAASQTPNTVAAKAMPVARPEPALAVAAAAMAGVAVAEPELAATAVAKPVAVLPQAPVPKRYEPIQADEVSAFKQALAAASASGIPQRTEKSQSDKSDRSASHSYTLLTGFEDTEMPETPVTVPALSATQYGDLI